MDGKIVYIDCGKYLPGQQKGVPFDFGVCF